MFVLYIGEHVKDGRDKTPSTHLNNIASIEHTPKSNKRLHYQVGKLQKEKLIEFPPTMRTKRCSNVH